MRVMSLQQFIQRQQAAESEGAVVVTVRNFLDAIDHNYDDEWTAEVTCDYPETGSFLVKITPPDDTEQ